jgi:hypothetical protein
LPLETYFIAHLDGGQAAPRRGYSSLRSRMIFLNLGRTPALKSGTLRYSIEYSGFYCAHNTKEKAWDIADRMAGWPMSPALIYEKYEYHE